MMQLRASISQPVFSCVWLGCEPSRNTGRPSHSLRLRLAAIASGVLALWLGAAAMSPASADSYLLGPRDRLKIKVFEWRSITGDAYEWSALSGEFTVAASGSLALPLIGQIPASGQTIEQLSASISLRLQAVTGMAKTPEAAVEVLEYRPFYITGLVAKPGQYPYAPGLSVLQAVSTAGGMMRGAEGAMLGLQRDTLVNRGDLRELSAERISLLARQSRLDAELREVDSFSFPSESADASRSAEIAKTMREERMLFDSRRQALASQIESIGQVKVLLASQVQSLKTKTASVSREIELAKLELNSTTGLIAKGLAVSSRQLAASQNVTQLETSKLDVELAILKAQQELSKADRDILDLRNQRRSEILSSASEIRSKLSSNAEKSATARALVSNIESQAPQIAASLGIDAGRMPTYAITRAAGGGSQTFSVSETDPVEPGDVVQVDRPMASSSFSLLAGEESAPSSR